MGNMKKLIILQSMQVLIIWNLMMLCCSVQFVQCQQVFENDYNGHVNSSQLEDPAFLNKFTEFVYDRLSGMTSDLIHSEITKQATFCVTDPQDDWNKSFNFSNNLDFLSRCILTTKGEGHRAWGKRLLSSH